MKYCEKCNKTYSDEEKFCLQCGAELNEIHTADDNQQAAPEVEVKQEAKPEPKKKVVVIKHRSIPLAIFFTLITCGIYGIYWMVKITNETNALTKDTQFVSGIVAFLLTIVTCGIFGLYWAYKVGQKVDMLEKTGTDHNAILYLVLSIFSVFFLGIVVYALAQDTINKQVDKNA